MKLAEYLELTKTNQSKFAKKCGLNPSTINGFLHGRIFFGWKRSTAVSLATNGHVTKEEVFLANRD